MQRARSDASAPAAPGSVAAGRASGAKGLEKLTQFIDLFGSVPKSLHPYLLSFRHALVDLADIDDRKLSTDLLLSANLKAMKYVGLADDVYAVAEGLHLQRMILVGHSMGGPVALEAARRLRGRVLGVVLVDTLHDVGVVGSRQSVQADAASLTSDFTGYFSDLSSLFASGADPSIAHWVEQQAITADPAAVIALKLDTPNLQPKQLFAAASVPIRAINAEPPLSAATNVEQNRKFADYEVILIPNVGHFLQLERPEIFNEALSRSVESIR